MSPRFEDRIAHPIQIATSRLGAIAYFAVRRETHGMSVHVQVFGRAAPGPLPNFAAVTRGILVYVVGSSAERQRDAGAGMWHKPISA